MIRIIKDVMVRTMEIEVSICDVEEFLSKFATDPSITSIEAIENYDTEIEQLGVVVLFRVELTN